MSKSKKEQVMPLKTLPRHVAVIMDGNGRWAKRHGLSRSQGHRRGVQRVKEVVEQAAKLGIEVLTLFAFSTENWRRPKKEIDFLMGLLKIFLRREIKNLIKNNIRFECIGRIEELPASLVAILNETRAQTKSNSGLILNLALNYGGRAEIIDAVNKIIAEKKNSIAEAKVLEEAEFSNYLYTRGLPDPDLLIRTSGEERISNFLLWQLSYSELYFTEQLWPDFTSKDFLQALYEYQKRTRRFGGI